MCGHSDDTTMRDAFDLIGRSPLDPNDKPRPKGWLRMCGPRDTDDSDTTWKGSRPAHRHRPHGGGMQRMLAMRVFRALRSVGRVGSVS